MLNDNCPAFNFCVLFQRCFHRGRRHFRLSLCRHKLCPRAHLLPRRRSILSLRDVKLRDQCTERVQFFRSNVARNVRNDLGYRFGRRGFHREPRALSLDLPFSEIAETRSGRDIFRFRFRFFLLFLRRKTQPILPAAVGPSTTFGFPAASLTAEACRLRLLGHHAVFESCDCSQQLAGFKWLDDVTVGFHPARFIRLERFQLAHRQQHRNMRRLSRILQPLADFQPAVAGHVHIEHDQIWFDFGDSLQGGRSVVDRDDVIPGIGQDLSPHVLGCHTVISEQYFPRQASSFGK